MNHFDTDDFQHATLNHTALQLAGIKGDTRAHALNQRAQQIIGMLELARRLDEDQLVQFLEAHRDALLHMIEST